MDTYGVNNGNSSNPLMTTKEYQAYIESLRGPQNTGSAYYTGGIPEYTGMTGDEVESYYNDILSNQQTANDRYIQSLRDNIDYQIEGVNSDYDQLAQQAYVQYMLGQKNLPQILSAQGISGGAAESTSLAQQLAYENSLNSNEQARQDAIMDLNQYYNSAVAENQLNFSQLQASLQQNMISAIQQAQQYENSYNQWVVEYQRAVTESDRAYALQQAQLAQDKANTAWQQAFTSQQYSDQLKQQEYENSLNDKQLAFNQALAAAELGDFSLLRNLGIDTTSAEKLFNYNLNSTISPSSYQVTRTSYSGGGGNDEEEPKIELSDSPEITSSDPMEGLTAQERLVAENLVRMTQLPAETIVERFFKK